MLWQLCQSQKILQDAFQIEIIESPKDYRSIIENGYNPEIVSMVFYIEEEKMEETIQEINNLCEWQEFAFSMVKILDE